MYPDGTLVRGPKALCELQGYVYDAWLRMAEIYDELGNKRRANLLRKKATALFEKFNEDFWDEQSGFYAFALDGEKKKVLSAASNVGQCLWSGIIAPERAGRVVKRLMGKDMWSGWGIRTLYWTSAEARASAFWGSTSVECVVCGAHGAPTTRPSSKSGRRYYASSRMCSAATNRNRLIGS